MRSTLVTVGAALLAAATADWAAVDSIIDSAISAQVSPGVALGVLDSTGAVAYAKAYGSFVYSGQSTPAGHNNPAVTLDQTWFDMASCTKIMGATTAAAALYQKGLLDLAMNVADPSLLGPSYAVQGKGTIQVRDLLMHQAGYPPDPVPNYNLQAFGCPTSFEPFPPLTYSCSELIFTSLLNQTLQYAPRSTWVYSDLSMITMQYVIGTIVAAQGLVQSSDLRQDCAWASATANPGLYKSCHFEAYVRTQMHVPNGLTSTFFLPPPGLWNRAMPTYNDPTWRHAISQGYVSDENSYALGGVAGHAGIFTTLNDALRFVGIWHYGSAGGFPEPLNGATRTLFTTAPTPAFSPRALGWLNQVPTDDYIGCGTSWSNLTAYHTGYTGTLLCMDPESGLSMVLLTTRVYPNSTGNTVGIHQVRQAVGDAVKVAAESDKTA